MKNSRVMTPKREKIKREIVFRPAFDKRNPDQSKNYGIHGVDLAFYLSGKKGAVQFLIFTNWQLKHVQDEFDKETGPYSHIMCHPIPADIGYHSPIPLYEGQKSLTSDCKFVKGDCYYGGSGLQAEALYWRFVEKGADVVWEELENWYEEKLVCRK